MLTQGWMHEQLQSLASQGFRIVAYGAAAKGMVLLHFLRQLQPRAYDFDFIVDDAPLKQGTYCPGTSIPVLPAANLSQTAPNQPLAIVILPWNFLEEITLRIQKLLILPRQAPVILLVPFPRQRLLQLHATIPPTDILPQARAQYYERHVQTALVAHFTDDDAPFCRQFIQHHAPMFDFAVVIDRSTSSLVQTTFQAVAPSSWKLKNDAGTTLDALYPSIAFEGSLWSISLRGSQLLVHPNIHAFIHEFAGHSLYFPVIRISDSSVDSHSSLCSDPLCHRIFALNRSAGKSLIPIVRTSATERLLPGREATKESTSADASASEGFIADLKAFQSDDDRSNTYDLRSIFIDSKVVKQAQVAWYQVFNRILRVGCHGCGDSNSSRD
jgi:hypothetical protein